METCEGEYFLLCVEINLVYNLLHDIDERNPKFVTPAEAGVCNLLGHSQNGDKQILGFFRLLLIILRWNMKRKALMSWSSGKDSAFALHKIHQNPEIDVAGLFCTVNNAFDRVAMHGVRVELLQKQAESIGLPLEIIEIPYPCSDAEYEERMGRFVENAKKADIEYFVFGDLFLEDIRKYREEKLKGSGIKPLFPIWGMPTEKAAREMMASGLKALITCIDPKQIPKENIGRQFDEAFLDALPETVDPCGENGEFHTFVYDGPMFKAKIEFSAGDIVCRDDFVFADVLPQGT